MFPVIRKQEYAKQHSGRRNFVETFTGESIDSATNLSPLEGADAFQ